MWFSKLAIILLCVGVGLRVLKTYVNGGVCSSEARMDGKLVIVTGANTGLGKTTAEELAKRGATVIMACRDTQKGDAAKLDILGRNPRLGGEQLRVMELDLASFAQIRRFVVSFKEQFSRLDVLINNAGVMEPPYALTQDGFEMTMGVNYMGHFLLTNLLLDRLTARPSRVVVLTSSIMDSERIHLEHIASPIPEDEYHGPKAYAQSKLANVLFTRELGRRLRSTEVSTYAVHPGIIITDIVRFWPLQQTALGRRLLYYATWWFTKDDTSGVQTVVCCAVDEVLAEETGQYYSDCAPSIPPDSALHEADAEALWKLTMDLVKLDPEDIHPLAQ
jgi:NAD(P)-dependent dehydrogenase (short-subunit alcohol dehydrogenase family)